MPLSPIDIEEKKFNTSFRGYAEDEVDEFLEDVTRSIREYEERVRNSDERVALLERQLNASRENEDVVTKAFVAAQRSADSIIDDAKSDAQRILDDARGSVSEIEAQRIAERERLTTELSQLRAVIADLRSRLHRAASLAETDFSNLDEDAVGAMDDLNMTDAGDEGTEDAADDEVAGEADAVAADADAGSGDDRRPWERSS